MIDPDEFRAVMGRFASGVTVVTSVNEEGEDEGMTVSAFCSLSLDPPLVLCCVDRAASMYDSLANADGFIVNILSEKQESLARILHQLGAVLHFIDDPRLRDTTVLNPHWVTDGAYREFNFWKKSLNPGSVPGIGFDEAIWAASFPLTRNLPDA